MRVTKDGMQRHKTTSRPKSIIPNLGVISFRSYHTAESLKLIAKFPNLKVMRVPRHILRFVASQIPLIT
jgi:hypothetical protein